MRHRQELYNGSAKAENSHKVEAKQKSLENKKSV